MPGDAHTVEGPAGPLAAYGTGPPGQGPVVLLCHDLPRADQHAADVGRTFAELADRLAADARWRVATATLRGAGTSAGDFSARGWLEDLRAVADAEAGPDEDLRLVGFGLGGALSLRLAVTDARVRSVACLGTADDLTGWTANPEGLVARCRRSGVITDPAFPRHPAAWAAELAALRPLEAAAAMGPRPLLVVHGADDPDVPVAAARALVDAGGAAAELRVVPGAGHWLRADPRVVATLTGWLERQH